MARKKTSSPTANWLDGATDVPREESAAGRDLVKRQRFYRRFIIAAVILLPISLVSNLLILGTVTNTPEVSSSVEQVDPVARAAATAAVEVWLDAEVSPVPGVGHILSWDGATTLDKPVQTANQAQSNPLPSYDMQTHSFTVVDTFGSTYTVSVLVAFDVDAGAVVLGTPSLIPNAPADTSALSTSSPWIGLQTTAAPAAVADAVEAWANAFTSGKPDSLRVAVQDDNAKHLYVPLFNVASHSVSLGQAAYLAEPGADTSVAVTSSSRMIVQVRMSVEWAGSAPSTGPLPVITYDLLVLKANGGAPIVVAWGAPGTGQSFEAYQNALTNRDSVSAPPVSTTPSTPSVTPSTEPSTDGGSTGATPDATSPSPAPSPSEDTTGGH